MMVMIPTVETKTINYNNVIGSVYNLRKELARQIWLVRSGKVNIAEALEYTRDLVTLCHDSIIDRADHLQHKIMSQISMQYGKLKLKSGGVACDDLKTPRVKTRDFLPAIHIKTRIG